MKATCRSCRRLYDDVQQWTMCPHWMRPTMPSLECAGLARPSLPLSVFAEDFSLLIRTPRRMRIARSKIRVLS